MHRRRQETEIAAPEANVMDDMTLFLVALSWEAQC